MNAKRMMRRIAWILGVCMILAACQPRTTPTSAPPTRTPREPTVTLPRPTATQPQPTATPVVDFTLSQDTSQLLFGPADPLAEFTGSSPAPFPEGYRVNTNPTGVGILRGSDAVGGCTIYVFRLSELKKAACEAGTYQGSNVSCVEEGSALYNQCSNHIVITPSGEAEHQGTILSAFYLPDTQISVFVALEGVVEVRPLRKLGDSKSASEPVRLTAGQFIYTAPDDQMASLANIPMRVVQPLDNLAPLVSNLGLEVWIEQTQSALDAQDVPIYLPPAALTPSGLTVTMAGQPFDLSSGLEAVILAAPWAGIASETLRIVNLPFMAVTFKQDPSLDIRKVQYDPAFSQEILYGMGYPDGFAVTIYYPEGDEKLATLARRVADALPKGGIRAEIAGVRADQIEEKMRASQMSGEPAIWLRLDYPVGN